MVMLTARIRFSIPAPRAATMERENRVDEFCLKTAASNFNQDYVSTSSNLAGCWLILLIFVLVFALLSMLVLTRIDYDRR